MPVVHTPRWDEEVEEAENDVLGGAQQVIPAARNMSACVRCALCSRIAGPLGSRVRAVARDSLGRHRAAVSTDD
eukprot:gene11310-biopygen4844